MVWLKSHAWNGGLGFLSWRKEKNEVLVEFHRRREKNMRWRNSTVSLKHIKKSVISNSKGFYHKGIKIIWSWRDRVYILFKNKRK